MSLFELFDSFPFFLPSILTIAESGMPLLELFDTVNLQLLFCSFIIVVCAFSSKLLSRFGVPSLLLFILLGIFFATNSLVPIEFNDFKFSEKVCTVALILIMFYGGFGTSWKPARPIAVKATLLASVGVVLTAFITGLFCYWALGMKFWEGMLLGSVISSTDAASVFSILRSKNLNLKHNLASLLEMESGSNDPAAYLMVLACLTIMKGQGMGVLSGLFLTQIFFGLIFGVIIGVLSVLILQNIDFEFKGLHTIFVVAIALLSFAVPDYFYGNGYLSAYITGIILGNSRIIDKIELVHFFDGLTWLMQILIFFLLGLLAAPFTKLWSVLLPAVWIMLFLTFIARPLTIFALLTPFRTPFKHQFLIAWAGLRGAASIVFSIIVVNSAIEEKNDIFHIVFFVALLSVAFQGSLLAFFARKLNLVDDSGSVFKTFNDYQDDATMKLIEMNVSEKHPWAGLRLRDIEFPSNMLVVLIKRGEKFVLPKGNTQVSAGDKLVINSPIYNDDSHLKLDEIRIGTKHIWKNKKLFEIPLPENTLIVMIRREGAALIPKGDTIIKSADILVLYHIEDSVCLEKTEKKDGINKIDEIELTKKIDNKNNINEIDDANNKTN